MRGDLEAAARRAFLQDCAALELLSARFWLGPGLRLGEVLVELDCALLNDGVVAATRREQPLRSDLDWAGAGRPVAGSERKTSARLLLRVVLVSDYAAPGEGWAWGGCAAC